METRKSFLIFNIIEIKPMTELQLYKWVHDNNIEWNYNSMGEVVWVYPGTQIKVV